MASKDDVTISRVGKGISSSLPSASDAAKLAAGKMRSTERAAVATVTPTNWRNFRRLSDSRSLSWFPKDAKDDNEEEEELDTIVLHGEFTAVDVGLMTGDKCPALEGGEVKNPRMTDGGTRRQQVTMKVLSNNRILGLRIVMVDG